MDILKAFLDKLTNFVPTAATILLAVIVIVAVRYILNKRYAGTPGHQFRLQMFMLALFFVGLLAVILTLPVSETTIGQLLSLLGILLSAAIALSATTFVGNVMAGLMLRAVRNFRPGDFIRVGDYFGRVSERGLLHIEIQTEDRDLTTLPNLYLVTNPVKVIRSSGTVMTAEVSLGYDVPHDVAEQSLLKAATDAGLDEPFVHVLGLNDFSVSYRVAGLLTEVKSLLSTRSRLHELMLDSLHGAGIEIVSPNFMNQRVLAENRQFIPKPTSRKARAETAKELPEAVVFDKAEEAESLEKLKERQEALHGEIGQLKSAMAEATDDAGRAALEEKIQQAKARLERLSAYIIKREKEG
jgi:small-conductance mechanosensitive channel